MKYKFSSKFGNRRYYNNKLGKYISDFHNGVDITNYENIVLQSVLPANGATIAPITVPTSIAGILESIICVIRFGIYGVLLGTIAALLYRTNDMIIYASHILERSCLVTYKRWILNTVLFFVLSIGIDKFTIPAANYMQLFLQQGGRCL